MSSGQNGPLRSYFACFQVDNRDDVLVLKIDVDLAVAIGSKGFRTTTKFDRRIDLASLWGDIGAESDQGIAVTGGHQNTIDAGIVNQGVNIRESRELANQLVGFEIKDNYRSLASTIGNESAIEAGYNCNSVSLRLAGNVGDQFTCVGIDDLRMSSPRNKEPVCIGVRL